ncbi:MAG TPA: hypothetical protein PK156_44415 [Polyangium sp.]|nr:hypothetical protein [Polyangium sp.]
MSEETSPVISTTTSIKWIQIPGRAETGPVLRFSFAKRDPQATTDTFVEEIRFELPRNWKPGTVYVGREPRRLVELRPGSAVLQDTHDVTWELSQRITRDGWMLIVSNSQPETALASDWGLDVAVLLAKPEAESQGNVTVHVDNTQEKVGFSVANEVTQQNWTLKLESDPVDTNALERGQEVVLRWDVQNVQGDGELRGSLPGANTMRIGNGTRGHRTVRALAEGIYTLTATVLEGGQWAEVTRRVQVNLKAPQSGLSLDIVPGTVFPGGPLVAYRSAHGVRKIQFMTSGDEPSLAKHNYDAKETTIVDSFVVPRGPKEGRSWTFNAVFVGAEGEKSVPSNVITAVAPKKVENSMFLNLPVSYGNEEIERVHGFAVGTFLVTSDDPLPKIAKRDWIAIAMTTGMDLWVRDPALGEVKAAADVQGRKWKNNWLQDALSGKFLGVGAARDTKEKDIQHIVAVRMAKESKDIAEVIEIALPLRENNPPRRAIAISDPSFLQGAVRVFPIGKRVFLLGDGAAISYERDLRITTYRDEPQLANVAFPEWDIVGLPAEHDAPISGYLFALEKKTGHLLRFDVHEDLVLPPRVAANSNEKVARLDKLHQAQASLNQNPPPFPCEELEEGRGITGYDVDGSVLEYLNPIDESSSLMVAGGVLVARSEVVDPSVRNTIQDRAYDPRLDVWARCGHAFAEVNGSTRNFFASTNSTLYCLADDTLWYVEGALAAFAGFMATEYRPIDASHLEPAPWPDTFSFPRVDNRTKLVVEWLDGRKSNELLEQGQLRLGLTADGETILMIEAAIDPQTGNIQNAKASAYATGREIGLCKWQNNRLTIAPVVWSLEINTPAGLVLPYSYTICGAHLDEISGESWSGQTLSVPSVTGETRCTIALKYIAGDVKKSTLDARAQLWVVNGIVADMRWEGQHAHLFDVNVEEGRIIQLALLSSS